MKTYPFITFLVVMTVVLFIAPVGGQQVAQKTVSTLTSQYYIKDYGAKGDAKSYPTGAMTSGSATLTVTGGSFTAGDVGKKVVVAGAGKGSATSCGYFNLSSYNTSTQTGVFTNVLGTLATGYMVNVKQAGAQYGGVDLYVYVSGSNVRFYTTYSDALANTGTNLYNIGTLYATTSVAGAVSFGPVQLVTTISGYTSATTVTLAATASVTVSGASVVYGTDDTSAFSSAISAMSTSGGTLNINPGKYLVDNAPSGSYPPAYISGTSYNNQIGLPAINIKYSNIHVQGSGRGVTTIMRASSIGAVFLIADLTNTNVVSNVSIKDLSVTYAVGLGQRWAYTGSAWISASIQIGGYLTNQTLIHNVETSQDYFGIIAASGACNTVIDSCIVHDGYADGISWYGYIYPVYNVKIINNLVYNRGDDGISGGTTNYTDNGLATNTLPSNIPGVPAFGTSTNALIQGNTVYNGQGKGIVFSGGVDVRIIGNTIRKTQGCGIQIFPQPYYGDCNNVVVSGNNIYGACTVNNVNAADAQNNQFNLGGIAVCNIGTSRTSSNIVISNNVIGADGANLTCGPYICVTSPPPGNTSASANSNIVIDNNICTGGIVAPTGTFPQNITNASQGRNFYNLSGIEAWYATNVNIRGNYIDSPYVHGIYVDSTCAGLINVQDNQISTPNTSGSSAYFIDILGGNVANVTNNTFRLNGKTVTANVNISPATNTNTGNQNY